jgi:cytochrome c peroxidase
VPFSNPDGTYVFTAPYGVNDQVTGRKTVSYVDAGYSPTLFWDGRATPQFRDPITNAVVINNGGALESQVLGPPVSTTEMGHSGRTWTDVATRISDVKPLALSPSVPAGLAAWINGRTYADLFQAAYGTPDITPTRIAMSIATYERTLYSDQTPLDQANAGIGQLTQAEQRGRNVFAAPGNGCAGCHAGALGSDNNFHYDGIRPQNEDTGRFQVTGNINTLGEFRTPSLRNVELRGSFFHNGQFTTLEQVVAFYNRGGDFNGPNKAGAIHPLNLSAQQQADLVAFLKRPFTDPRVAAELPPFDRPGLYTESSRVPQIVGSGRAGSGAATPQIRAISPPLVGNPNFTVSVTGALGNAPAVLVIDAADPGVGTSIPSAGSLGRVATNTQNTGASNGWASVNVAIPDSSAVTGHTYFARWYIQDPAAANGFSVSQAAQFTVFGQASTASVISVSGRVLAPDGRGLRNTTVTLTDALGGIHRATTSSFGFYIINDISTPGNCTMVVSSRLYRFASQTFSISGDLTNVDFVGLE